MFDRAAPVYSPPEATSTRCWITASFGRSVGSGHEELARRGHLALIAHQAQHVPGLDTVGG
jgi:hypothetical protein